MRGWNLRDTILHSSEPSALSVAGLNYEAPVRQHLHDETHHVSIRDDPKQFQVESTVPHGVIYSCQVQKHYPSLLIVLKDVFDVLC